MNKKIYVLYDNPELEDELLSFIKSIDKTSTPVLVVIDDILAIEVNTETEEDQIYMMRCLFDHKIDYIYQNTTKIKPSDYEIELLNEESEFNPDEVFRFFDRKVYLKKIDILSQLYNDIIETQTEILDSIKHMSGLLIPTKTIH